MWARSIIGPITYGVNLVHENDASRGAFSSRLKKLSHFFGPNTHKQLIQFWCYKSNEAATWLIG